MDDKTIRWMRARLSEADVLTRKIVDAKRTKDAIMDRDLAICERGSGSYYYIMALPPEARDICVGQIEARIVEFEKALAEL